MTIGAINSNYFLLSGAEAYKTASQGGQVETQALDTATADELLGVNIAKGLSAFQIYKGVTPEIISAWEASAKEREEIIAYAKEKNVTLSHSLERYNPNLPSYAPGLTFPTKADIDARAAEDKAIEKEKMDYTAFLSERYAEAGNKMPERHIDAVRHREDGTWYTERSTVKAEGFNDFVLAMRSYSNRIINNLRSLDSNYISLEDHKVRLEKLGNNVPANRQSEKEGLLHSISSIEWQISSSTAVIKDELSDIKQMTQQYGVHSDAAAFLAEYAEHYEGEPLSLNQLYQTFEV